MEYISGLYFNVPCNGRLQKTYLPQIDLQAHAAILSTTSRTTLKQTFVNPSAEKGIREVRYTFPLYDGVSVVGFKCNVGDRTIVGEVKEKEKARAVFQEAIARGETSGLLEQLPEASDVFSTTVGNIPPDAKVIVEITYLGELKHDMEVDGIRYTIPNVICPRYGAYPDDLRTSSAKEGMGTGISITIDAETADGSFIKKIQSPSHPISMNMGTLSDAPDADPVMTRASASLTLGTAQLDIDFVIQIIAKNTGVPKAILETHPTIPNQRALMATLVPKFALPPEKPELIFVCDRSGSMGGIRITLVIQALKVFLKSLPVGVKFNICSFGSSYSFLWKKSVTYSQKTLEEAIQHVETFTANYGGTEMLGPLKATIDQRYKDLPLDVMLLTDGEIWNQQQLFAYLNESVSQSKSPIRLFTLGIGNGVSHALIEGVAKAGDGFSQTVGEGEKMDTKVVRMLKGALSPHIRDYTLEVKYSKDESIPSEDDDFVEAVRVADSLKVNLKVGGEDKKSSIKQKVISLFDSSADPDKEEPPVYDETGESRYAHLPPIPTPRILQAPQNIPSLFAFNRTTAYLLLGPAAPRATPTAIVLRGTSNHGLLELEIPVVVLDQPGETIHQLAAKKAIAELEQGRGWLSEAKDESDKLLKSQIPGKFDDMVEREAVRLGVQFQVGGKWCSFVAVEKPSESTGKRDKSSDDWEWLEEETRGTNTTRESTTISYVSARPSEYTFDSDSEADDDMGFGVFDDDDAKAEAEEEEIEEDLGAIQGAAQRLKELGRSMSQEMEEPNRMLQRIPCESAGRTDHFTENSPVHEPERLATTWGSPSGPSAPARRSARLHSEVDATIAVMHGDISSVTTQGERLDDLRPRTTALAQSAQASKQSTDKSKSSGLFGMFGGSKSSSATSFSSPFVSLPQFQQKSSELSGGGSLSGSTPTPAPPPPQFSGPYQIKKRMDISSPIATQESASFYGSSTSNAPYPTTTAAAAAVAEKPVPTIATPEDLTHFLISLQTFEGFWIVSPSLLFSLQISEVKVTEEAKKLGVDVKAFITALVVAILEGKLQEFEGSWELVVDKARDWLSFIENVDELVKKAENLV